MKKITCMLLAMTICSTSMIASAQDFDISTIEIEVEEEVNLGEALVIENQQVSTILEEPTAGEDVVETVEFADATPVSIASYTSSMKTTGLAAKSSGAGRVSLSWNAVSGATGYLVYAQKNGVYGYVGMTTQGTTFNDTNALANAYNYYWVFPYTKNSSGTMVVGQCSSYKYAKGVCAAVTYLKSASVANGAKLTWQSSYGADGYLIYGIRPNASYEYISMTTSTTFTDLFASKNNYTYYWVYPYHKDSKGNMYAGLTPTYTYGKAVGQSSSTYPENVVYAAEESILLESYGWINALRIQEGNGTYLERNELLESAAMIRAYEISTYFSHTRPNGSSCFSVLSSSGYRYSTLGENIQYFSLYYQSVDTIAKYGFVNWYNSAGHYANMVNSSFNQVGVGIYVSGFTIYMVQMFGYGY